VIRQWQKRRELSFDGDPEDLAKVLLSFFMGFIVQSALLGDLDPKTITRGMKGFLGAAKIPRPSSSKTLNRK